MTVEPYNNRKEWSDAQLKRSMDHIVSQLERVKAEAIYYLRIQADNKIERDRRRGELLK